MRGLAGQVVVVTGGASGIGLACVERLVEEGCTAVIADVQQAAGEQAAERLGERAHFVHADVTDEASIAALVDGVVSQHGRLDGFFANAGVIGSTGPISQASAEAIDLTIAVNFRGVILCVKHAARVMGAQGSGTILVTGSPGGLIGGAGPNIYSATKAGVMGFVRAAAAELRAKGIRVLSVLPGSVATPMTAAVLTGDSGAVEKAEEVMAAGELLGRAGRPGDMAGVVAFLLSDDAFAMTGSEVLVDAGYSHAGGSAAFAADKYAGQGALLEAGRRAAN